MYKIRCGMVRFMYTQHSISLICPRTLVSARVFLRVRMLLIKSRLRSSIIFNLPNYIIVDFLYPAENIPVSFLKYLLKFRNSQVGHRRFISLGWAVEDWHPPPPTPHSNTRIGRDIWILVCLRLVFSRL